jgi:hypothetical protein
LGYYKIAFGKVELSETLERLSDKVMEQTLLITKNKSNLQGIYDDGNPIIYNAAKSKDYLFVYVAMRKKRKTRKIDWTKYNIEEEKEEDMTTAQVVLYRDGLVFIESNNKFPIILQKLNEVFGEITPYTPNKKLLKRFYEEAEEINYMKLVDVGRMEPNPHPEDEFTEKLVKSIKNTEKVTAYAKHGNIKADKLMNGLEKYSTPIELTGKKLLNGNVQKFSINIKKKTKNDEVFYSISIKKPKEESPEIFEGLSKFVKRIIESI